MKYGLLLMLALLPMAGAAQSHEQIVNEILANNPTLAADKATQRAEVIARVAENRLEATEIGFGYKWPDRKGEAFKLDLEITQAFDWPGAYGARRRAAKRAEAATDARIRATERDLELQTHIRLLELVDANRRCAMLSEIVANLDSLHETMHGMLDAGAVTELDHRKVALEEVAMKQQLAEAESARVQTLTAIAALNGGTLPAGIAELSEYPAQELLPLEEYLKGAAPEVEAMRAEAETKVLDAKAERMALYPGFSIGYAFAREEFTNFHGFTFGLRLPEYSAKPKADAARWEARALELQAEQAQQQRRADITADHSAAQIKRKLLTDYGCAFGSDYPRLLQRSLQGGQITYINYLSELNFYLAARLDYLSQTLAYHTLLAKLKVKS